MPTRTFKQAVLTCALFLACVLSAARARASYSSVVLTDSPVRFFAHGEAAAATVAVDGSTSAVNGTYAGSPTLGGTGIVPSDAGTCLSCDGVDDVMTAAAASAIAGSPTATLEAFVSRSNTTHSVNLGFNGTLGGRFNIVWQNDGNMYVCVENGTANFFQATGAGAGTGARHVVLVFDGALAASVNNRIKLYVDGSLVTLTNPGGYVLPATLANAATLGTFYVGKDQNAAAFSTAKFQYTALYSSALSATRVQAHFATTDTTAPTLTLPTGVKTGTTTATVGATTNDATGRLYTVVTPAATTPTAAQVKAGQSNTGAGAAYAGNVAVTTTGAKTISAYNLWPGGTLYAHSMHEDSAGNQSNVVTSAAFTTDAGTIVFIGSAGWTCSDFDEFTTTLKVGVLADDPTGITNVAIVVNGGAPTNVTAEAYNSDSTLYDYFRTLTASDYSAGVINLTGTVTAGSGATYTLPTLNLYANPANVSPRVVYYVDSVNGLPGNTGSTGSPFQTILGAYQSVYTTRSGLGAARMDGVDFLLRAGNYVWGSVDHNSFVNATTSRSVRWMPDAGVARASVVITSQSANGFGDTQGVNTSIQRFENLTLNTAIYTRVGGTSYFKHTDCDWVGSDKFVTDFTHANFTNVYGIRPRCSTSKRMFQAHHLLIGARATTCGESFVHDCNGVVAGVSLVGLSNAVTTWASGGSYAADQYVLYFVGPVATYFKAKTTHSGVSTTPDADSTNWNTGINQPHPDLVQGTFDPAGLLVKGVVGQQIDTVSNRFQPAANNVVLSGYNVAGTRTYGFEVERPYSIYARDIVDDTVWAYTGTYSFTRCFFDNVSAAGAALPADAGLVVRGSTTPGVSVTPSGGSALNRLESYSVGTTSAGVALSKSFTVTSTGTKSLGVGAVRLLDPTTGQTSTYWDVTADPSGTITVGGTATLTVRLKSTAPAGSHSVRVILDTNTSETFREATLTATVTPAATRRDGIPRGTNRGQNRGQSLNDLQPFRLHRAEPDAVPLRRAA